MKGGCMKASVQTNFKNPHSTSYLARDIAQYNNKGSSIEAKIETVLNQLRETTGVRGLKQIDSQVIEAYVFILQDKVENSELSKHTAETYISALNRIIEYTNTHLNKNLETVSQSQAGLSRNSFQYIDRSVSKSTHEAFLSFLSQNNDIKAQALSHSVELQRAFGLRLRESLAIKQETIREALRTNVLHLTGQDGTKNSRSRDIPVKTEKQIEALKSALNFQKENNLKSLAPTTHLREQYSFAKNTQDAFNKSNNDYFHYHGERHAYAQQRIEEGASKIEVSRELGHNRQEVTRTYANI
jgi:site-specific recombinase XerD